MLIVILAAAAAWVSRPPGARSGRALVADTRKITPGHSLRARAVRHGAVGTIPTATITAPVAAVTAPAVTAPAATAPAPAASAATTPDPVVVTPATVPVATLVAQVEAAGIEPGSNWSWSMGDTAIHCGAITGAGTGCTFGAAGLEYTVFAGSPTLALVAHELANAETQNDAVPSLLGEVGAAEVGTSWSPTDAVASCLVVHFMGVNDNAAGAWQCPATLASIVADHIHDTT